MYYQYYFSTKDIKFVNTFIVISTNQLKILFKYIFLNTIEIYHHS